jgi:prepilin peptidase CpaA
VTAQALLAGGVGIAACIDDLRRRQISNWIPSLAFASGLVLQTVQHGWRGAGSALLGTLAGASVFLISYLLGGMGGGDVKLMAGFGALLGARLLFEAALWTAGCGGVMALGVIVTRSLGDLFARGKSASSQAAASSGQTDRGADSIPYAPAIAAGVWLSLVGAR